MRIAGIIIAGGRSARMGEEKAFLDIAGKSILGRIIERISPQVTSIVVNANGPPERFAALGLPVIHDLRNVGTPLAGLHAGLKWSRDQGFGAILTVPSDCPFLPSDLVTKLASRHAPAAIASSRGQPHVLTGLWHSGLQEKLEQALDGDGVFRVKDWATKADARTVDWPTHPFDPFLNVNTPEDLAEARRIAAEFDP